MRNSRTFALSVWIGSVVGSNPANRVRMGYDLWARFRSGARRVYEEGERNSFIQPKPTTLSWSCSVLGVDDPGCAVCGWGKTRATMNYNGSRNYAYCVRG